MLVEAGKRGDYVNGSIYFQASYSKLNFSFNRYAPVVWAPCRKYSPWSKLIISIRTKYKLFGKFKSNHNALVTDQIRCRWSYIKAESERRYKWYCEQQRYNNWIYQRTSNLTIFNTATLQISRKHLLEIFPIIIRRLIILFNQWIIQMALFRKNSSCPT